MKRNLKDYAEAGKRRKTANYDLYTSELLELKEMALSSRNGLLDALAMAYHAGIEAGYRIKTAELKKGSAIREKKGGRTL